MKEGTKAFRNSGYSPWLFELDQAGVHISIDVAQVASHLGISPHYLDEGRRFVVELRDRRINRAFPEFYDTESLTLALLFGAVRQYQPALVFETGVANGASTRTLLAAMEVNGDGRLISFDTDPRAKASIGSAGRTEAWEFVHLSRNPERQLREFAEQRSGQIGLWYHDSDHRGSWQQIEFEMAYRHLAPNGMLISDDVDGNCAFADFVQKKEIQGAVALFDHRKVSGYVKVTEQGN